MFSLALTGLNLVPSGVYQDRVGVGTPSDTHFNVTLFPIHDLDTEEEMLLIVAASVDKVEGEIMHSKVLLHNVHMNKGA